MVGGISLLVPTNRYDHNILRNFHLLCESAQRFPGKKEVVICMDRPYNKYIDDKLADMQCNYPFLRLIRNSISRGVTHVRSILIESAKNEVLLFTDDDCQIPYDWVSRMYQSVQKEGIVTGSLRASNRSNSIGKFEEYIDYYRVRAVDSMNNTKFISFPNFGIIRDYLPVNYFDISPNNTTEDIDLACRLRLLGEKIRFHNDIEVKVDYPRTMSSAIKRKWRHSKGIVHLKKKFGDKRWRYLEIGDHKEIYKRWYSLTVESPFSNRDKNKFLMLNFAYCLGLTYYMRKFKRMECLTKESIGVESWYI